MGRDRHPATRTRAYQRLRTRLLYERPTCEICGVRASVELDHMVPLRAGGSPTDPANLCCICKVCHGSKTKRDRERYPEDGRRRPRTVKTVDVNGVPLPKE